MGIIILPMPKVAFNNPIAFLSKNKTKQSKRVTRLENAQRKSRRHGSRLKQAWSLSKKAAQHSIGPIETCARK